MSVERADPPAPVVGADDGVRAGGMVTGWFEGGVTGGDGDVGVGGVVTSTMAGTVTVEVAMTFGPVDGVPVAVPTFVMDPALRSAAVVVYVAVQLSAAPAASCVVGHTMTERPVMGSVTVTGFSVTLPVLVTR